MNRGLTSTTVTEWHIHVKICLTDKQQNQEQCTKAAGVIFGEHGGSVQQ